MTERHRTSNSSELRRSGTVDYPTQDKSSIQNPYQNKANSSNRTDEKRRNRVHLEVEVNQTGARTITHHPNKNLRTESVDEKSHSEGHILVGYSRYTTRIYVGDFDGNTTRQDIIDFCKNKKIKVHGCRTFQSGHDEPVSAKITISQTHKEKVLERGFWPKFVRARLWLSQKQWEEKFEEIGG